MKIVSADAKNFMGIGHIRLSLADRGLNLIQGVNEDDTSAQSNGSSKSSIPDAISWCLFGETARGESGDAIVNRTAGKDCDVNVFLQEGKDTYGVNRYRKHAKHKNRVMVYQNGTDITKGTDKLTQEMINKIVGCNVEIFNAAIYAGQEKMPNLPGMADKELKMLVEEGAGTVVLQKCYEEARGRLATFTNQKSSRSIALANLSESLARSRVMLDDLETRESEWNGAQATRVAGKLDALSAHRGLLPSYHGEMDLATMEAARVRHAIGVNKGLLEGRKEIERKIAVAENKIRNIERGLSPRDATLKILGGEILKGKGKFESASSRIGTPCGECGKLHDETSLSHAIASAKSDLVSSVKTYRELKSGRDDDAIKLTEAMAERDAIAATLTDVSDVLARIDELNRRLADLCEPVEALRDLEALIAADVKDYEELIASSNPHTPVVEKFKAQCADLSRSHASVEAELIEINQNVELAQQAVEVFGPGGVRAHILDHVTPFLNTRTSHYLSHLSDGNISAVWSTLSTTAKGELREKFNIEVTSLTGGDRFGLLSGGEKRKVRLSCAMALQDLIAQRALKPIELFMADEIDDALDGAALERLMDLLNERASECGTVLVISHNDIGSYIREVTTVTKKDGQATASGSLVIS